MERQRRAGRCAAAIPTTASSVPAQSAITAGGGRLAWHNPDAIASLSGLVVDDVDFGNLTYASDWAPPVSVEERDDDIVLIAELPE